MVVICARGSVLGFYAVFAGGVDFMYFYHGGDEPLHDVSLK